MNTLVATEGGLSVCKYYKTRCLVHQYIRAACRFAGMVKPASTTGSSWNLSIGLLESVSLNRLSRYSGIGYLLG